MGKAIDEEPYGYAFRVYSRPVDMERDYVALDGSPTNQPHVEGDTVGYKAPYGFGKTTPITLGEDVVRERAVSEPKYDLLYGRQVTDAIKPQLDEFSIAESGYNNMLQNSVALPHKGVSLIGLSDPAYSLYRFDEINPTDDLYKDNQFLQIRMLPRQLFENIKNDKRFAVRRADISELSDDERNDYVSNKDDMHYSTYALKKGLSTTDEVVPTYVMDLDKLSAMPKAYFNSKYMPFYNTILDTGDAEATPAMVIDALARGDIEYVRRMLASGSYGEDIANSNMYKRAKATRAHLTPEMYGDTIGDTLRTMLYTNVLGTPADRFKSLAGIGIDLTNDNADYIRDETGSEYGVPGNRPYVKSLLERDGFRRAGGPALNEMHTMTHRPERHKDFEYYDLLSLLHHTLSNASSWAPGDDYAKARIGVPMLVKVPLSSIYTRDDVERGDLRAQRDALTEIVAEQFTPLHEIPAEEIYKMWRHYNNDLYSFELFNAPIKYTPEWYAKLRKLDTKYGNKLLKIAGIKKGKKGRPIISDEEKKFILDDMRSELNKPQYADLKEYCTTSRLNDNVCQALTTGGMQWR